MSTEPLCFTCRHFRQTQPLTFLKPGDCRWDPGPVPPWLEGFIWSDDYYGPKREIWGRGDVVTECPVYQERSDAPSRVARDSGEG